MEPHLTGPERSFKPRRDAHEVRSIDTVGIALERSEQVTRLLGAHHSAVERCVSAIFDAFGQVRRVVEPVLGVHAQNHRRLPALVLSEVERKVAAETKTGGAEPGLGVTDAAEKRNARVTADGKPRLRPIEALEAEQNVGNALDQHGVVGVVPGRGHLCCSEHFEVLRGRHAQREIAREVLRPVGRDKVVTDHEELGVQRESERAFGARGGIDDSNATGRPAETVLDLGDPCIGRHVRGNGIGLGTDRCGARQCNDAPQTGQYPTPAHSPRLFPTRNYGTLRVPRANLNGLFRGDVEIRLAVRRDHHLFGGSSASARGLEHG